MIGEIKNILTESFRQVFYNTKFVLLIWGLNFVTALVLSMPVYYLLSTQLNHSMLGEKVALEFDHIWFIQFVNMYDVNMGELPYMFYILVGVYLLVQTFYSGGLITIFNSPKKNHTVDFFYGGVKYWLRFTRVLLVSLLFFAVALFINDQLGNLITWGFADSENVMGDFVLRSIRYLLLLFFILCITIISDYSKVALAVGDDTKVVRKIGATLIFLKNNFTKIFSVFIIVGLLGLVGAIFYNYVSGTIPKAPFYFLILSFILQQTLIIFRLLIRMLFFSSEVNVYKDLSAEEIAPAIKEENIGV